MDDSPWHATEWLARTHRSMERAWRTLIAGAEGARALELEGVLAAVMPSVPERSVFNSVFYERPQSLAATVEELAAAYDEAGVQAWTVWVPETDRASAQLLESAGHTLDATPRAMALELARLAEPDPGDLDWVADGSLDELKRINDAAYGYEPGTFEQGIGTPPEGAWRTYEARLDGLPASVLATTESGRDCAIWWVATAPEARGRGLAGRLLHLALADARGRGMRTSTLQATKMGYPVYARLGYRDLCALHMWERRQQP